MVIDYADKDKSSGRDGGGSIVAFAKWQEYPAGQNLLSTETSSHSWPASTITAFANEIIVAWTRAHKEIMSARAHWCLDFLAIDPTSKNNDGSSISAQ